MIVMKSNLARIEKLLEQRMANTYLTQDTVRVEKLTFDPSYFRFHIFFSLEKKIIGHMIKSNNLIYNDR